MIPFSSRTPRTHLLPALLLASLTGCGGEGADTTDESTPASAGAAGASAGGSGGVTGASGKGGSGGASGTSGKGGMAGNAGQAGGASGSSGKAGMAGSAGQASGGASGSAGKGGMAGSAGQAGGAGVSGNGGASGTAGAAGNAGASGGSAGAAGSAGTAGSAGSAGTAGSAGSAGTAGSAGSAGTAGSAGSAGSAGAAGQASCAPAPTSSNVVSVKDHGAKGDGVTDDTAAIQKAVNAVAGTGGTVTVPAGTYMIDALVSVNLKGALTFALDDKATLRAIPNSASNYAVVRISGSNVNVVGGTIQGERDDHGGTTGEWGHCVQLKNAQHVVVEGVIARDCWGDGFYVSSTTDASFCSVRADRNRRQGMSITSVSGMVVKDSTFENTAGTPPEDGLDIEPNVGETVSDVLITNCTFTKNAGYGLEVGVPIANTGEAMITGVVVDGNSLTQNGTKAKARGGIGVSNLASTKVINNTSKDNLGEGILLRNDANASLVSGNTVTGNSGAGIEQYLCKDNVITGNTVTGNAGHGIWSPSSTGGDTSGNTVSGNGLLP